MIITLLLAFPLVASASCVSDTDCNMAGSCVASVCECDQGFHGDACELLSFGPSYACGEGGYCEDTVSSWGGGMVRDDATGLYHMYLAEMSSHCHLGAWLTNSRIRHAVSKQATGPFERQALVFDVRNSSFFDGVTQHNPTIARAPDDGTYLLYYMGSSAPGAHAQNCSAVLDSAAGLSPLADNQRVGLATARSPDGPWSRPSVPILEPSSPGHWDDLFTTNPSVHVFTNGSVLLVYKGRSKENQNAMLTGTAFAQHWSGPYNRRGGPMDIPTNCEDAGVYLSRSGVFRALFHCGCDYRVVWSLDGINWNATAPAQPWCHVTYQDGSKETLSRRERPQWIVDEKSGEPLFVTNGVSPTASHEKRTFTMITPLT